MYLSLGPISSSILVWMKFIIWSRFWVRGKLLILFDLLSTFQHLFPCTVFLVYDFYSPIIPNISCPILLFASALSTPECCSESLKPTPDSFSLSCLPRKFTTPLSALTLWEPSSANPQETPMISSGSQSACTRRGEFDWSLFRNLNHRGRKCASDLFQRCCPAPRGIGGWGGREGGEDAQPSAKSLILCIL